MNAARFITFVDTDRQAAQPAAQHANPAAQDQVACSKTKLQLPQACPAARCKGCSKGCQRAALLNVPQLAPYKVIGDGRDCQLLHWAQRRYSGQPEAEPVQASQHTIGLTPKTNLEVAQQPGAEGQLPPSLADSRQHALPAASMHLGCPVS